MRNISHKIVSTGSEFEKMILSHVSDTSKEKANPFFSMELLIPIIINSTDSEEKGLNTQSNNLNEFKDVEDFNKSNKNYGIQIEFQEKAVKFFRFANQLLGDQVFNADQIKKALEQKEGCRAFEEFIKGTDVTKDPDNLKWLLPLITLFEEVNEEKYKKIDAFLMPIWIFNNFTAKDIFGADGKTVTLFYIQAIILKDLNKRDDSFQKLVNGILNLKSKKNSVPSATDFKDSETDSEISEGFDGNSNGELAPVSEEKNSDTNLRSYIEKKIDANVTEMHNILFQHDNNTDIKEICLNWFDNAKKKPYNSSHRISYYLYLFLEFFRGCIFEKNTPTSDGSDAPASPDDLSSDDHRTNSGGCKLMVQGVSHICEIGDPFTLIDEIEVGETVMSEAELNQAKESLKKNIESLLELQGAANVYFNDAISAAKELVLKEKEPKKFIEDVNKNFDDWLQDKFEKYNDCLVEFGLMFNNVQQNIIKLCKQNSFPVKLGRYLKLIVSALIGVPQWSCKLTKRYFLVKIALNIESLKQVIKDINNKIYPIENI